MFLAIEYLGRRTREDRREVVHLVKFKSQAQRNVWVAAGAQLVAARDRRKGARRNVRTEELPYLIVEPS